MTNNNNKSDHVTVTFAEERARPDPEPNPRPSTSTRSHASVEQSCRQENETYDNDFFHGVVKDAGRWAFAVVFVEVWVLSATRTHLFRPEQGWWIDPYARGSSNSKFEQLTNPSLPGYLLPVPVAPGVGLPGALWSEAQSGNIANRRGAMTNERRKSLRASMKAKDTQNFETLDNRDDTLARNVKWREVKALADDPDQPHNPRLQFLAECGLGLAAGVPFKVGPNEGLVIYMAREKANIKKLCDPVNEDYLAHATLLIGSAYSLRGPRLAAVNERKTEMADCMKRVTNKISALKKMNKTLKEFVHEASHSAHTAISPGGAISVDNEVGEPIRRDNPFVWLWNGVYGKCACAARKFSGADVKGSPMFSWEQSLWSFAGAFIGLAMLTSLNQSLVERYGPSHMIILGPFGALMTLQYGLTAAPASQPRNAVVGMTLSLLISHGVGQSDMELKWKQTIGTALAIGTMVKLGVTHPPAGAAAFLFAHGRATWQQMGLMIVGNVIAILLATVINNFNDRRQYPTFWGLRPIIDFLANDEEDVKKTKAQ